MVFLWLCTSCIMEVQATSSYEDMFRSKLVAEYEDMKVKTITITITSSDTNVIKIKEHSQKITIDPKGREWQYMVNYGVCNSGVATITVAYKLVECSVNIVSYPKYQKVIDIQQQDYSSSKITGDKVNI